MAMLVTRIKPGLRRGIGTKNNAEEEKPKRKRAKPNDKETGRGRAKGATGDEKGWSEEATEKKGAKEEGEKEGSDTAGDVGPKDELF